jgi:CRP/FNR family transcriptional regulator
MEMEPYIRQSTFFKGLSSNHYRELASIVRLQKLKKRGYLFHENEQGENMFLLLGGNLQLHKNTEEGREVVIRIVKPSEVFAEVVLFERDRYPVSARALVDSEVLVFSRDRIHQLLCQKDFRNAFIAMLIGRQRYLAERIQELTTLDVEQRFFNFLKAQYGTKNPIYTPLSKKDIAAAIGTTPESLSRLIFRLHKEQVIDWQDHEIYFLSKRRHP